MECGTSTYCNPTICKVTRVSRNIQHLTVGCNLTETQHRMNVHVSMNYKFTVYRKFLIDLHENFCDAMDGLYNEIEAKQNSARTVLLIMKGITSKSNINHTCPYSGYVVAQNLVLDEVLFPGYLLPAGQYRIDVHIYNSSRNRTIIYPKVFVTIPASKSLLDLSMG